MNRVKRDYCARGRHPRWRAWTSRYDMVQINWPWLGDYCTYCGARVTATVGSGPARDDPLRRERERAIRDKTVTLARRGVVYALMRLKGV